jgi:tetratricopeptide (TPR) repeat protein
MPKRRSDPPLLCRPSHRAVTASLKILLLGLMALSGPLSICFQVGLSIEGKVRMGDGGPLPSDVKVQLEEAEGVVVSQVFVGADAKFRFDDLKGEYYRLIVTAKGFQTARQDVDMHYLASRFPIIYLTPAERKQSAVADSNTVSATDLAAPKKARKEYEKGHAALQNGKYLDAREHLEKAIAEDPCYARAHACLGVALSMQHLFVPAEASLRKSVACDAGFLEGYVQLAMLLNLESRHAESEAALQEGLKHFPGEWQLYYQLGVAERGIGQLEKAEAAYLKAQSINPAVPPEFHVKLADVFLREKKYDKAYGEMLAYLRADPTGSFAGETKALMNRLETSGMVPAAPDRAAKASPPPQ